MHLGGTKHNRINIRKNLITWSILTESDRRPSPYHPKPVSPPDRRTGPEQPERYLTATFTNVRKHPLAAICPWVDLDFGV